MVLPMRIASELDQEVPEPCDAHCGNGGRLPRIIKLDRSIFGAAGLVPYSNRLDCVRPATGAIANYRGLRTPSPVMHA